MRDTTPLISKAVATSHDEPTLESSSYGGTTAGVGNVISGNSFGGMRLYGSFTVEGNEIGTDATGNVALGNGNSGDGIFNNQLSAGTYTINISNNLISGNNTGISVTQYPGSQATYTIANNL